MTCREEEPCGTSFGPGSLKEAGVKVDAVRYNGTIHDFMLLNALRHGPSTEAAIEQANEGARFQIVAFWQLRHDGLRRLEQGEGKRHEARRWSIVNLSIIVSNECKALMNVCAMVRSVSL